MKTAYFVSSRTCSNEQKYEKCLLFHDHMIKDMCINFFSGNRVLIVKDYAKGFDGLNMRNVINNPEDEDDKKLRRFLMKFKSNKISKDEVEAFIEGNKSLLEQAGIFNSSDLKYFRQVYKLNSQNSNDECDWSLYGVDEINADDNKNDLDIVRPQWCDLLIKFILDKDNDNEVENIHLFLHDKDIAGHDSFSAQLIDGVEECQKINLISNDTSSMLKNKNLTIVFFQHTESSCVMDIIGESEKVYSDRINGLNKAFNKAIDYLRGISDLRDMAERRKLELEQNHK